MKKQKNFIGAVLVLCVLFSFAGCAGSGSKGNDLSSIGTDGGASKTEHVDDPAGNLPENSNENENRNENSNENENRNENGNENSNENENRNENSNENSSAVIEEATVRGSVVAFAEDSCTITPPEISDDSNEAVIAAPGNEDSEKNITIHYQQGCSFQIVEIYVASGKKIYSDAEISDIKKQTSLLVYGDWTDTHNVNATKVFIARYIQ